MQNNKILELCLAHGLGGLEMFAASCYDEFSKKSLCRVVVSPQSKLDKYLNTKEKFHIKRRKFFPFISAWQLARYIDKEEIDIVHFHWTKDILIAVLARKMSRRKVKIVQSRHMRMTRFKNDIYHKWLYKNVDMLHAVTKAVSEQLHKFIPEDIRPKIELVYLGTKRVAHDEDKVELLRKKYKLDKEFIVGMVGRVEEGKGQYKLIEALEYLQNLDIKIFIIGSFMDSSYKQELFSQVQNADLEEKVIFVDFTQDVSAFMQLFDVSVLATQNETFGLVIIEAMANKSAVIATNKGGPLEIIEDEVNGLLFDGSSEDLSKKIKRVYGDNVFLENIAKNGYNSVKEKFDFDLQMKILYSKMRLINE